MIPGYKFSKTARKSQRKLVPLYTVVPAAELERRRREIDGQIARQMQRGAGLRPANPMGSSGPVMRAYTPGRNERLTSTNWDRNADFRKALAKAQAKPQNTGSTWNWDWLKFPTNNTHKYTQFDPTAPGMPTPPGHSNVGAAVVPKVRNSETREQTKQREDKEIDVGGRHVRNVGVMLGRTPIDMTYDIPMAASYLLQWGLFPFQNVNPAYRKSWQDYRDRISKERDQVRGLLKYDPDTQDSHKKYYEFGTDALNLGGSIALGAFGPKAISVTTKLPNIYKKTKPFQNIANYVFGHPTHIKSLFKDLPGKAGGWQGDMIIPTGVAVDALDPVSTE